MFYVGNLNELSEQDYDNINIYVQEHGKDQDIEEIEDWVLSSHNVRAIYNFARCVNCSDKQRAIAEIKKYGNNNYARATIYDLKNMIKREKEEEKLRQKGLEEAIEEDYNFLR